MHNKLALFILSILLAIVSEIYARRSIPLTLDSAVDIAMNNSYRIKYLELEIKRTRHWLDARHASLKSSVYMNLRTPDISKLSDYKWNSILQRDEMVQQNTQMWESELSIKQPVIFFGYPTNGYFSLNYRMYRYLQKIDGESDLSYYNRLYLKFEQPFFLPNELKNDLERAELGLEENKLRYVSERLEIIEDISDDFYDAFVLAYYELIYQNQMDNLEQLVNSATAIVALDSTRQMEKVQAELEMANVRENLLENQRQLRMELTNIRQRLRLADDDSVYVIPMIDFNPVKVNLETAIDYGFKFSPDLRILDINRRESEIDLEDVKGRNAPHLTLEVTYGLEKQNHQFRTLWEQFDNSNSATLNAYIPLWDWGERKSRIQAEQVDVHRRDLQKDEYKERLKKNIVNTYTNLIEFQDRFINMKKSLILSAEIAGLSLDKYTQNQLSLQDILQIIDRHKETERKYIDAYLGYRRSLLWLMTYTYYDFERGVSLRDEFDKIDL